VSQAEITEGKGRGEGWGGAKSYDGEKAWPSMYHSILFAIGGQLTDHLAAGRSNCYEKVLIIKYFFYVCTALADVAISFARFTSFAQRSHVRAIKV
jgi:hypothetical protein